MAGMQKARPEVGKEFSQEEAEKIATPVITGATIAAR
jgi:hypothetical protein